MDRKTLSILNATEQLWDGVPAHTLAADTGGHHRTPRINPRRILGGPAHAMAFKDDPDDDRPGSGGSPEPTDSPPEGYVPQDRVNSIVQERLARERQQHQQRLAELGYESFDELQRAERERREAEVETRRQAEEAERKRLEQQQEWQKLREFDQRKADERAAQLEQELERERTEREQLHQRVQSERVQRELLAAATTAQAYRPEQVAQLLRHTVSVGEDGELAVLDVQGRPRTNGRGEALTLAEHVGSWVDENPHFKRAASGRGAGGSGSGGSGSDAPAGLDLAKIKAGDITYIRTHKDEIRRARADGLLD